ncbi:MAG: hypothetical protein ACM3SO_08710 [Betaproteobacteria bacterium]
MPSTTTKPARNSGKKQARLYHLDRHTIQKLDALAVLCGGHGAAVTYAIDATYEAAGAALKKLKVRPPR